MPNLDRFAAFAEKYGAVSKSWATRATRATPAQEAQKTAISAASSVVAQPGDSRATRATPEPASKPNAASVAHVAQVSPKQATEQATPETEENCGFQGSVAHVAHENDKGARVASTVTWAAEDWRAYFHERAGIAEDNNLSRAEADARALEWTLVEWLRQNPPMPNDPDLCTYCGELMAVTEALPVLNGTGGFVWLHSRCHKPWREACRAKAMAALVRFGVPCQP